MISLSKNIKKRHIVYLLIALGITYFAWDSIFPDRTPHVARITISGSIGDDNEDLLDRIHRVGTDDSAKALVLWISSPGGTVYGSESLFEAVKKVKLRKPVVTLVGGVAASGGYLISCASNAIIASQSSIIGSIGVFLSYPQFKPFLDKLGISVETIKSSPLKGEPSPYSKPNPQTIQNLKELVNDEYHWFVKLVSEERHIPYDKALTLSSGLVWSGTKAKKLGLIDAIGGNDEVWKSLYSLGVDKDVKIIKDWKSPKNYWFFDFNFKKYVKSTLEDSVPFIRQANFEGLLAVWRP
ncbi:putative protease IV transmembrane protein [Candidatus Liberibacter solanacearum CLso-ZC1]|uniref:Putative protease IV transmembrane protein n=1 Tax=Liberibacter solanacearum (strain CLso-ZC1) TaxID=658172 RepID=E4UC21_LIBSC|nr:signal peptide peptidase SppA [Candidatus Liberibacter solanacearum]ADR51911.1 putative protease IV transmembrane protein [Candidatus Liberibacter solanacearum CLso-ZC1]